MQDLSYRSALAVAALPTASAELKGVTVRLTTDDKPYWCNGTTWVDLTAAGAASPAGNDREIQYNNAGTTAGAANVEVHGGDLIIGQNASPTTPPTDYLKFFGKRFGPSGSRVMAAAIGPSGLDYTLQPALWRQKVCHWNPPGNATTVPGVNGFNAPIAVGTATARSVATTNVLTRAKRLGYVSAATAGSLTGHYNNAAQFTLGNGSNVGGFFYSCRFGISDATLQTVGRTFVGLTSSVAAFTNVEPSTLTNCIGVGNIASGTTLRIFYGGSAAQTSIDLGVNFPVDITSLYDLTLWSPPNQNGVVYYYVEKVGAVVAAATGVLGPGTAGTTLPANTTLLAHRAWRSNGTAAAAVGIDISSVYTETDW